jgi:hypothetical protein
MNTYIYAADLYCEKCARIIKRTLAVKGLAPQNTRDESSYDSGDYPKGPYSDGGGESDSPQHCASREDCVQALELEDGWKVGCWLENPLTSHGVQYVREEIANKPDNPVVQYWATVYAEEIG